MLLLCVYMYINHGVVLLSLLQVLGYHLFMFRLHRYDVGVQLWPTIVTDHHRRYLLLGSPDPLSFLQRAYGFESPRP